MTSDAPLVAIVGRPNVGKSALFNRLTRSRHALVERVAGTTRDRQYGECTWRARHFRVVDTGGMEGPEADPFGQLVRGQVDEALREAELVLFVVDAAIGVTAADEVIANLLRRSERSVLLVANKGDRREARANVHELYRLGLGEPLLISAYHAEGIGELLDTTLDLLPGAPVEVAAEVEESKRPLRIAIVGRPNVGKSSLVNAVLGEERTIVSEVPGTTRDAIDTPFTFEQWSMILVDTAGIRRRGKIVRGVERHSVQQADRAIARSDVVFMLIDAADPTVSQDTHIAGHVAEQGKGLILIVNKWDLAEPATDRHQFARQVDRRYRFVPWAPVHFTSALTGDGIAGLLELAVHVRDVRRRRIQTSELNRIVQRAVAEHAPRVVGSRRLKLLYVTQAEVEPPTFVFFVNDPALLHFAYRRYLENRIRDAFGFEGTAIRMRFRRRSSEQVEVPA